MTLDRPISTGWVDLRVFKNCIPFMLSELTILTNKCFSEGIFFPKELKIAQVVPLFKRGDLDDMSNYRPISVLSKVFEKPLKTRLLDYFEKNELFCKE